MDLPKRVCSNTSREWSAVIIVPSGRTRNRNAPRWPGVTLSGVTDIERGTWHTPIFRVMMVLGGGVKKGLDIQLDMVASTLETEAHRP